VTANLDVTRDQILGFRLGSAGLLGRSPGGRESLVEAARAGLSDSMPRAAVLSLHARVERVVPETLADRALVQVWGPRFSAYAIAAEDVAVFTLGRHPTSATGRDRAERLAARLADHLGGDEVPYGEAGRALGVHPNSLRYATTTGTVLIRWDGARQPTIRCVPPPEVEADDARLELARRYLHALGPGTPGMFGAWAGVRSGAASAVFAKLAPELVPVRTPIGDGWALAGDEATLRASTTPDGGVRLLPSGDVFYLLWGDERRLLVPDEERRPLLWTPRVWPGAVLAGGEVIGTWRRSGTRVTVAPWGDLAPELRRSVEREAVSLPVGGEVSVAWEPA